MSREDSSSPAGDAEFDQWLSEHPEAEGELADLQSLRELYQSAAPPIPEDSSWQAAPSRIHETILAAAQTGRRELRPLWLLFGASAAAAILVFLLTRSLWTPREGLPQLAEEPFPVAEEADVSVVSMDAQDVSFLVVGEPPIPGRLEFARPEDVRVIKCERCPFSGQKAHLDREGEVPMFVSTAAGE